MKIYSLFSGRLKQLVRILSCKPITNTLLDYKFNMLIYKIPFTMVHITFSLAEMSVIERQQLGHQREDLIQSIMYDGYEVPLR